MNGTLHNTVFVVLLIDDGRRGSLACLNTGNEQGGRDHKRDVSKHPIELRKLVNSTFSSSGAQTNPGNFLIGRAYPALTTGSVEDRSIRMCLKVDRASNAIFDGGRTRSLPAESSLWVGTMIVIHALFQLTNS